MLLIPPLPPLHAARLFCTAGVHPTRCGEVEAAAQGSQRYWDELRGVLQEGVRAGKTVAVGECGLDADRWARAEGVVLRTTRTGLSAWGWMAGQGVCGV